ncbi:hypothetical protein HDV06_001283 [Boothiomyces sp. JEL0866]|nr:hypothetical protein HDV06_001283 [Boothiomyces sp. JEL0866]
MSLNGFVAPSIAMLTLGLQRNMGVFYILNVNSPRKSISTISILCYGAAISNLANLITTFVFVDSIVSPYGNSPIPTIISLCVLGIFNSLSSIMIFMVIILRIPAVVKNISTVKYRITVFVMGLAMLGRGYQIIRQFYNYTALTEAGNINIFGIPGIKISNVVLAFTNVIEAASFVGTSLYFLYQIAKKIGADKQDISVMKELYLKHKLVDYLLLLLMKAFQLLVALATLQNTDNSAFSMTGISKPLINKYLNTTLKVWHVIFVGSKEILNANKPTTTSTDEVSRQASHSKSTVNDVFSAKAIQNDIFVTHQRTPSEKFA